MQFQEIKSIDSGHSSKRSTLSGRSIRRSIAQHHSHASSDNVDVGSTEIVDFAAGKVYISSDITVIPPELESGQVYETDKRSSPRHDRTEIGNSVGRPMLSSSDAR